MSWTDSYHVAKEQTQRTCFPRNGFWTPHVMPVVLSLIALSFTGAGSWDCTYFKGATISFTGGQYGLWTVQDSNGKCQLWDVLFFSYNLDEHLVAARTFSMTAMLLGLALCTTTSQASQYHVFSWGIGCTFVILFLVSVTTSSIFNVWIVFWLFSYVIFVLIVRYAFVHPIPRRISSNGSKIIGILFICNGVLCLLTLIVLGSDYCTCSNLTSEELEGRDIGINPCHQECRIGGAAACMIIASLFWFVSGYCSFKYHIQPEKLRFNKRRNASLYGFYYHRSVMSRAAKYVQGLHGRKSGDDNGSGRGRGRGGRGGGGGGGGRRKAKNFNNNNKNNNNNCPKGSAGLEKIDEAIESDTSSCVMETRTSSGNLISSSNSFTNMDDDLTTATAGTGATAIVALKPSMESIHEDVIVTTADTSRMMMRTLEDGGVVNHHHLGRDDDMVSQDSDFPGMDDLKRKLSSMDEDDDDWVVDNRGFCQKMCCDFRVKKRNRKEMITFWTLRVLLAIGFGVYFFFNFMLIGSRAENDRAARAPSTTPYFTTDVVCAFNPQNPWEEFRTFPNRDLAHIANYTVAHCGECGLCSNPSDIQQYVKTRKTIASQSKSCASHVYLGSKDDLVKCLQDEIGFQRPCTTCWATNMENTADKCLFTCLRTLFSGFMTDNNVDGAGDEGWLNACLYCDEKRSGPGFVTCSGVARRRLGIVSEIERNPDEQCPHVDIDWVEVDWDEIGFN